MSTKELIQRQMLVLGKTRKYIEEKLQCDSKTLGNYINGKTIGGQYLALLLKELEISPEEWSDCTNVKERMQK